MRHSGFHSIAVAFALLALSACGNHSPKPPSAPSGQLPSGDAQVFRVKPYIQLGDSSQTHNQLMLLWHADEGMDHWSVQIKATPAGAWTPLPAPASIRVEAPHAGTPDHRVWSATLEPLQPGETFDYQVLQEGRLVFSQTGAKALPGPGQPQRVVVVGDMVEGEGPDRAVAHQIWAQHPDYVVTAGDLVYEHGTIAEYQKLFYPTYNADRADPAQGAPLMRGTLMVGSLGNHDVANATRTRTPPTDSMTYYFYWDQPLNGPDLAASGHVASLNPPSNWQGFLRTAGNRYPRMGSFSFDAGAVHWTILDTNPYVDWGDPHLKAWLAQDLFVARNATWRFVVFHHPSFNLGDRDMKWPGAKARILWPILDQGKVDLIFNGDIHCYQRTRPMRFIPQPSGTDDRTFFMNEHNLLIDTHFDGTAGTRPMGLIQIITGAGGAHLHNLHRPAQGRRAYDQELVGGRYSFTELEIDTERVNFKQLDDKGALIDAFVLSR